MSKVKQWAEDTAEQKVDSIISQLKDGQIDLDTAKVNITQRFLQMQGTKMACHDLQEHYRRSRGRSGEIE